ncbi:MAG TPA: hypothetical protein VM935_11800 [Chitinophagaceae bacterium]|jgi:hypothetical protein|nr:hypothetical protein [Chitinophagaceae bacterium]
MLPTTTLIFASINDLWDFRTICKLNSFIMQTDKLSLTGQLSSDDIEMAVAVFNAKVIEADPIESSDSSG